MREAWSAQLTDQWATESIEQWATIPLDLIAHAAWYRVAAAGAYVAGAISGGSDLHIEDARAYLPGATEGGTA